MTLNWVKFPLVLLRNSSVFPLSSSPRSEERETEGGLQNIDFLLL